MRTLPILLVLGLLVSACAPATAATSAPAEATASSSDAMVELARSDLAGRLSVAPDSISLVSVESVDWPDAGLGCPQLGVLYTQAVTPGLRITLQSGIQKYDYHTDLAGRVVLCGAGGPPAATPLPSDTEIPYSY